MLLPTHHTDHKEDFRHLNEIHTIRQSVITKGWTYPLSGGNLLLMFWDNLLHSTVWPPLVILPLWVRIAFSLFPSSLSLPFYCHVMSPFPSLCHSPIYSPFPSLVPPLSFLYHSDAPSCPSLPQFSTNTPHPPLTISLLLHCSLFSSPSSCTIFLSFHPHYFVTWVCRPYMW